MANVKHRAPMILTLSTKEMASRAALIAKEKGFKGLFVGQPGINCNRICSGHGLKCSTSTLLKANNCNTLTGVFQCDRCNPNYGPDQPAFVSGKFSENFGSCLYNSKNEMDCGGSHPDTLRLCACG